MLTAYEQAARLVLPIDQHCVVTPRPIAVLRHTHAVIWSQCRRARTHRRQGAGKHEQDDDVRSLLSDTEQLEL